MCEKVGRYFRCVCRDEEDDDGNEERKKDRERERTKNSITDSLQSTVEGLVDRCTTSTKSFSPFYLARYTPASDRNYLKIAFLKAYLVAAIVVLNQSELLRAIDIT